MKSSKTVKGSKSSNSIINRIFYFVFNMKTAFFVLLFGLITYLIVLDEEGAFSKKFCTFGPEKDDETSATFMNMKIDTWNKVITVYAIGFCTSFMIEYYNSIANNFIHQYIWNPAYAETINMSKSSVIAIGISDQVIFSVLMSLQFFITLTTRLQFILPSLLGKLIVNIPYLIFKINENTFIR